MMKNLFKIFIAFIIAVYTITSEAEVFNAHCRNYPPYLYFDGSKCIGAIPDLVTDLMNEQGHQIVWSNVPWIRSIKVAKEGKVDLLIRHSMTQERKQFLHAIPYGYYTRELFFFKSPTLTSDINSYQDIKKYNIGAIRGNFYSPKFSTLDTNILTLVGQTEQLINMLERGRIDLAVTSSSHSDKLFTDRFVKSRFVDSFDNPLYISIPKKSNASKYYNDIATLLLDYRKSGKIDQYFLKYNLPTPKQVFE